MSEPTLVTYRIPNPRGDILTYLRDVVARSRSLGRGVVMGRREAERAADEIKRLRRHVDELEKKLRGLDDV